MFRVVVMCWAVFVVRAFGSEPAVIMVGDSITASVDWKAAFPSVAIENRGVDYSQIGDIIRRDEAYLTQAAPQKIFILIGVNDLIKGSQMSTFFRDLTGLIKRLSARSTVVVQTIMPVRNPERWDVASNDKIRRVNRQLGIWCREHGIELVDLAAVFASRGELDIRFSDDGIHLNNVGKRAWVDLLAPLVEPGKQAMGAR